MLTCSIVDTMQAKRCSSVAKDLCKPGSTGHTLASAGRGTDPDHIIQMPTAFSCTGVESCLWQTASDPQYEACSNRVD